MTDMHPTLLQAIASKTSPSPLIPVPKNSAQRQKLLIEALRWCQENARCIETRRYVSRVLRVCEKPLP